MAERLRGLTSNVYGLRKSYESEGFSILCEEQADYYQICKAVSGYIPPEHMHPCDYEELHARLADLIDPDTTTDTTKSPDVTTKCDREALLALADEIEMDGAGALDDEDWCKPLLEEYARRIREACGERAS